MSLNVVFYDSFKPSVQDLTRDEQAAVMDTLFELAAAPDNPGLQSHRVGDASTKCWSARVIKDVRLIYFRSEQTIVPAYADHHDDAYKWAEGRSLDVHPQTGAAQIVITGERREEIIKRVVIREEHDPLAVKPYVHLSDDELLGFGVPRSWLQTVRDATTKAFLEEIGDTLPAEAQECLFAIANGEAPSLPTPPTPKAINPFAHPDAKRRFYVVESDEDLKRALTLDWEQWVLFLHPSQREAVDQDFAGPARVTGGPGTGKSVVAVHRAARLARQSAGPVLLTSFSKTLANHLKAQIDSLMGPDPARARLDVVHLHHLAVETLSKIRGAPLRIADATAIGRAANDAAVSVKDKSVTPAFLEAEWDMVVDAYGVTTWEEYAGVDRAARGTPLNRAQREVVWSGIEEMRQILASNGLTTWSTVCWDLVEHFDRIDERPYVHVIADEAQDFGPAELRLLRALAEPGTNDVFLASDANQRIFKPYTPVARAGLEVRGRSVRLHVNYRMTEQIRRMAGRIVTGLAETDEPSSKSISLLTGAEPEIKSVQGVTAEIQAVAAWLKNLTANGYSPGQIAIFARKRDLIRNRVQAAVRAANLASFSLDTDEDPPSNRVAIGTMHRSKGLQFRAVAIMGVEDGVVPLATVRTRQPDEAAKRAFVERERNLLYVACSRAREQLYVSGVRTLSEFLMG